MKRRSISYRPLLTRRQEKRAKRRLVIIFIISIALIYSFFTWFFPALVGSLSVLNQFKPAPKVQTPIFESTTLAPPVLNIPYEATNTAQITIAGYSLPESQVEIYLDDELITTIDVREDGSFSSASIDLNQGTNNLYGKTVQTNAKPGETPIKSLASKTIQIIYDNTKPKLEVNSPSDNQTFQGQRKIDVTGQTSPDNVAIMINDLRVVVNQDGNFSQTIELQDGENNISIVAQNSAGNSTQISRKVIFQP